MSCCPRRAGTNRNLYGLFTENRKPASESDTSTQPIRVGNLCQDENPANESRVKWAGFRERIGRTVWGSRNSYHQNSRENSDVL